MAGHGGHVRRKNVTTDSDKLQHTIRALLQEVARAVCHLIKPEKVDYTALKTRLMTLYGQSDERKFDDILLGWQFYGVPPSRILSEIRSIKPSLTYFFFPITLNNST